MTPGQTPKNVRDFVFGRSGDGCDCFKIFVYLFWFILGWTTFVFAILERNEFPGHQNAMIGIIVASCPAVTLSLLPILVWHDEIWIVLQNIWTFASSVVLLVYGSNMIHSMHDHKSDPVSPKLAVSHSILTGILLSTTLYFHFLFRRQNNLLNNHQENRQEDRQQTQQEDGQEKRQEDRQQNRQKIIKLI